jgi:hypothetical protein
LPSGSASTTQVCSPCPMSTGDAPMAISRATSSSWSGGLRSKWMRVLAGLLLGDADEQQRGQLPRRRLHSDLGVVLDRVLHLPAERRGPEVGHRAGVGRVDRDGVDAARHGGRPPGRLVCTANHRRGRIRSFPRRA